MKRGSYIFPALSVGKWTQSACRLMIFDFRRRVRPFRSGKVTVFSDGNDDCTYAPRSFFPVENVNYGQLIRIRRKSGKLPGKKRKIVFGDLDEADIDTVNVENFNGILRERVDRSVRKTRCFSKRKRRLISAITLFQFYWNFMSEFRRDQTPAMIEGISNKIREWDDFFHAKLTNVR